MIGFKFSATQPESPWPMGICREENSFAFSPFTYAGTSTSSCTRYTAIASNGIILCSRMPSTERLSSNRSGYSGFSPMSKSISMSCRAIATDSMKSVEFSWVAR